MKLSNLFLVLFLSFVLSCTTATDADTISSDKAKNYIGETKTVQGLVVSTRYAAGSRGRPTFLNLDKPYPKQIFTIVIWGSDRSKFDEPPEIYFDGKRVLVTGKIAEYRGSPQIVVKEPNQIKLD